ncbi:MAG: AMP-binding protein, partial [bacterium]|nr:AMP-binding protein [bacterium]
MALGESVPPRVAGPPEARFYHSGDLARWLPDGNIEFLGRIDTQVKIRGFRIDPAEILFQLEKHPEVKEGAVIVRTIGDEKTICAYFVPHVPQLGNTTTSVAIRSFLSEQLPPFMVPTHILAIDSIPLNQNGKIDTKALPTPTFNSDRQYTAPRTQTEKRLAFAWAETLGLPEETIGTQADFFQLGGHSLKAGGLVALVHKETGVKMPLAQVFKTPTLSRMANYIATAGRQDYVSIPAAEKREYYPLSAAQQRFFILQQLDPESTALNMPQVLDVEGDLDIALMEKTLRQLIHRHESLRTSFIWKNETPVQRVHREVDFRVEEIDDSLSDPSWQGQPQPEWQAFDLGRAPLLRAGFRRTAPHKYVVVFDMHHIISDGTSMATFIKEFTALYSGQSLAAQPTRFKDFSIWQAQRLQKGELKARGDYWRKTLSEPPLLNLPLDFPRPVMQSFKGKHIAFDLPPEVTEKLKALLIDTGCTLYMVLLAAFTLLLARYSRQDDILVGTPTAGRNRKEVHHAIGLFLETIVLRNKIHHHFTADEFLQKVKENTLNAYENQEYPYSELIKQLDAVNENDLSRNPLFDVMLNVLNQERAEMDIHGLRIIPRSVEAGGAKVDLTLDAIEIENASDKRISLNFGYATALFRHETIRRMAGHFVNILHELVSRSDRPLCRLEMTSPTERSQILEEFNHPVGHISKPNIPVHLWFSQQAQRTPDAIALAGDSQLSYGLLDRYSDNLASFLREQKGVRPKNIVATTINGTSQMAAILLAILKAGAAYLPINPDTPNERIDYMLKDSNAVCRLSAHDMPPAALRGQRGGSPSNPNGPFGAVSGEQGLKRDVGVLEAPAYVIYTSGSTGRPKGVLVTHNNLTAYIHAFFNEFQLTKKDIVIQQASFAFDAFVEEMYPVLLRGGKLAIPPREIVPDIPLLCRYMNRGQITMITCSPLMLEQLDQRTTQIPRSLRIFISGGDILKNHYISNLLKIGDVYNTYGPTETTVCATYYKCRTSPPTGTPPPRDGDSPSPRGGVSIGKPIFDTTVLILDHSLQLLPVGVPGQLCIAGHGTTAGYLNNP